jgi:hypothetical protein
LNAGIDPNPARPSGARALLALILAVAPAPAAAQGVLDEFSYEGLYFAGIGLDVGGLFSDRLDGAVSGAVRLDAGFFAPRVRPLFSLTFFRSDYDSTEIAELEDRLRDVVNDPTNDFTIDAGTVSLSTLALDVDLQWVPVQRGPVRPYLGLGAGAHLRFVEGPAIEGTFIEDALETIVAALNASAGFEIVLSPSLHATVEGRGILATGLRAVSVRGGFMLRFPRRAR